MKKLTLAASILALGMVSAQAASHVSKNIAGHIGVVDMQKVLKDTPQVQHIRADMKKQFEPQVKKIKSLQAKLTDKIQAYKKNLATMSDADKKKNQSSIVALQKQYQSAQATFQTAYMKVQKTALAGLMKQVQGVISSVAKKDKLQLVIAKTAVAYAADDLDVTDAVISGLK